MTDEQEKQRVRDARLVLAASRGVWAAVRSPLGGLAEAARRHGYVARTPEGDAFETAFTWAQERAEEGSYS